MKNLKIFIVFITFAICYGESIDIDNLVKKSNLYFQQPLQDGKPQEEIINLIDILESKNNVKVIIHGFLGNRFHSSIRPLRNAYMTQGMKNVFLADWEKAATLDYHSSRRLVAKVGYYFAKLLEDFLNKHEIPVSEVHIIGHSLGAHIAGNMGRYFNGSLGRITGLDPALPFFSPNSPDSLKSNNAVFVDVIHTDYPVFGDITPRGSVDFYPNYGFTAQKGCEDVDLITASKFVFEAYSCSHNRAVILFAETVGSPRNFPSIPCTFNAIKMRSSSRCFNTLKDLGLTKSTLAEAIAQQNEDIVVYMGEHVSKGATGIFYLETYDAPPYGMGVYSQMN